MSSLTEFTSFVNLDYGFHSIDDGGKQLTITAQKDPNDERLGISLVVKSGKLYVHSISPSSLFARTDLEVNDLVESINGINFVHNPDLQAALSLVKSTQEIITLVVKRYQTN